jgi:hypothetical protein
MGTYWTWWADMARYRAGGWAVLAGLVALAGCTHHRSTGAPAPSPTATNVPTATAGVTPTARVTPTAIAPVATPAQTGTPTQKAGPSTARPGPSTPTTLPTAPSVSVAPPAGVAFVITQADTGKTFTLPSGSTAELRLGGNLRWSAPQATPAIVALTQEPGPAGAGDHAWKITTTGHGITVIDSTGAPICEPGHVCAQYVVLFRAIVVVP